MTIFALTPQGLNAFKAINRRFLNPNKVNPQDKQLRQFLEGKTEKAIVRGKIGFPDQHGNEHNFTFKVDTATGDTQDIYSYPDGKEVNLDQPVQNSAGQGMRFHDWFDLAASRHFVELCRSKGIRFW